MKFAVGTKNKAKLDSVRMALDRCKLINIAATTTNNNDDENRTSSTNYNDGGDTDGHEKTEIIGVPTESHVGAQPFSASESRTGAKNRAMGALAAVPDADFGIGLEGGIEKAESDDTYFECGWMCVVERATGRVGWGSSARFVLDNSIVQQLKAGKELAQVMDEMTGEKDVRSGLGAMGILTGGSLGRAEAYCHGLLFALAPFLSPEKYWTESTAKQLEEEKKRKEQQQQQ